MADVQLGSALGLVAAGGGGGPSSRAASATDASAASAAGAPSGAAAPGAAPAPAGAGDGAGTGGRPLNKDQIKSAVKKANEVLSGINTQLVFVFDDHDHSLNVKLLDIQTQKVVQQIPSAAMPATANALADAATSGTLVNEKA